MTCQLVRNGDLIVIERESARLAAAGACPATVGPNRANSAESGSHLFTARPVSMTNPLRHGKNRQIVVPSLLLEQFRVRELILVLSTRGCREREIPPMVSVRVGLFAGFGEPFWERSTVFGQPLKSCGLLESRLLGSLFPQTLR